MDIQITGRNLEITTPIRNLINEKFGKLTNHFKNITNVHVILKVSKKFQHDAEVHVDLSHGNLFAKTRSEDMYTSINLLVDKIDRQVVKHKEAFKDHKDRSHATVVEQLMSQEHKTQIDRQSPW